MPNIQCKPFINKILINNASWTILSHSLYICYHRTNHRNSIVCIFQGIAVSLLIACIGKWEDTWWWDWGREQVEESPTSPYSLWCVLRESQSTTQCQNLFSNLVSGKHPWQTYLTCKSFPDTQHFQGSSLALATLLERFLQTWRCVPLEDTTIQEPASPPPSAYPNSFSAPNHHDEAKVTPNISWMCSDGTERPGHFLLCLFYKTHSPEKNGGCSRNIRSIGDGCKTMGMYLLMPLN